MEVEMVSAGVEPPLELPAKPFAEAMEMDVTPPPLVDVATQPMPLVVLFQPSTMPPAGATP